MTTETVDRRTILRYRGEPVPHEVRFMAGAIATERDFGTTVIIARCDCGWSTTLEDAHTAADLTRLARQHEGIEDPPEGTP